MFTNTTKLLKDLLSLVLIFFGLLLFISLISFSPTDPSLNHTVSGSAPIENWAGLFGAYAAGLMIDLLGISACFLVFGVLGLAVSRALPNVELAWWRWAGVLLLALCVAALAGMTGMGLGDIRGGGILGGALAETAVRFLSVPGAALGLFFLFLAGVRLLGGVPLSTLLRALLARLPRRMPAAFKRKQRISAPDAPPFDVDDDPFARALTEDGPENFDAQREKNRTITERPRSYTVVARPASEFDPDLFTAPGDEPSGLSGQDAAEYDLPGPGADCGDARAAACGGAGLGGLLCRLKARLGRLFRRNPPERKELPALAPMPGPDCDVFGRPVLEFEFSSDEEPAPAEYAGAGHGGHHAALERNPAGNSGRNSNENSPAREPACGGLFPDGAPASADDEPLTEAAIDALFAGKSNAQPLDFSAFEDDMIGAPAAEGGAAGRQGAEGLSPDPAGECSPATESPGLTIFRPVDPGGYGPEPDREPNARNGGEVSDSGREPPASVPAEFFFEVEGGVAPGPGRGAAEPGSGLPPAAPAAFEAAQNGGPCAAGRGNDAPAPDGLRVSDGKAFVSATCEVSASGGMASEPENFSGIRSERSVSAEFDFEEPGRSGACASGPGAHPAQPGAALAQAVQPGGAQSSLQAAPRAAPHPAPMQAASPAAAQEFSSGQGASAHPAQPGAALAQAVQPGGAQSSLQAAPRAAPRAVQLPPLSLLSELKSEKNEQADHELEERGQDLMDCLADFNVQGRLLRIVPGPVVTMFEIRPAPGIKVSRIAGLCDDIALAMRAIAVRVQAPIPGTDAVGIEIPNERREVVSFREIVGSQAFREAESPLTMALGKDIAGEPAVTDLAKMPHLLVAGATGAGKSVCLNSILLSLIFRARPDQLKLLLIDPKRIEMAIYANLPHLVHPVVTEMSQAKSALDWAVHEMDKRYEAIARLGVRNVAGYNEKLAELAASPDPETRASIADLRPMPYMVIIIDELADLMLTAGKEVEVAIVRLAQLARAAGIHLIIATQRPSVDVVTGLIKANFPCRISFQVTSKHDSRTILDTVGAEHLLGKGDMLFKPGGGRMQRLHGAFVPDNDVAASVEFWKKQLPPQYEVDLNDWNNEAAAAPGSPGGGSGAHDTADDPLYGQAVEFVMEQGRASISLIQRRFRIGFNKAARFVEQMEQDGIIGPADGSKPRQVIR